MPDQTSEAVGQTRTPPTMVIRDPNDGYSRTQGDLPVGMANTSPMPPTNGIGGTTVPMVAGGMSRGSGQTMPGDDWCRRKAQAMYKTCRNYMDSNITLGWERNLYHFRGEHGPGTPYVRSDWRRARTFRPKTRANVKAQEAAHAAAAFATQDFLDCQPFDPTDERQVASAHISKGLAQYRLENADWKWFVTAQGAFQDTKVYGVCVSHQYWAFEQEEEIVPAFDQEGNPIHGENPETGETDVPMGTSKMHTVRDEPVVDLFPPENFLFDPMCDWRNPAQSSPYLCALFPMYAEDVLERMSKKDPKTGQLLWRKYSLSEITATKKENVDNRTRRAREGHHRIEPETDQTQQEYMTVWAHLNIARVKGVDLCWWTLGTELVLTDVIPLTDMYPHLKPGMRPFVMGYSVIEAHRNYPDGDVAQIAPLQEEINAVANQRLDNVRLVLNKRYFIRRGSQMDLDALMRNIPGGGVMTNDPQKDVQIVNTPDVTSSAYQEQDRLSSDLDELVGGFGAQAAQGAGKTVDRAGSLDQIQGAAGAVQDYGIKIFFDTWMEPVLKQLVLMEQKYETDQTILAVAAKQSPLYIKLGDDMMTDELIQQELVVRVNVGMGNTDPVKRIQKLVFGVGQVIALPGMGPRAKSDEIANEIFGSLGYKDASRFFMNDQELAQHQKTNPQQPPPEIALKQKELELRDKDNTMRNQRETTKAQQDHEWRMQQLAQVDRLTQEKIQHQTGIAAGKNKTDRDIAAAKEANRLSEVNMQRADGAHERVANARNQAQQAAAKAAQPPAGPPGGGSKGPAKSESAAAPKAASPAPKPAEPAKPAGPDPAIESIRTAVMHLARAHMMSAKNAERLESLLQQSLAAKPAPAAAPAAAPKKRRVRRGHAILPSGGKMQFEMADDDEDEPPASGASQSGPAASTPPEAP